MLKRLISILSVVILFLSAIILLREEDFERVYHARLSNQGKIIVDDDYQFTPEELATLADVLRYHGWEYEFDARKNSLHIPAELHRDTAALAGLIKKSKDTLWLAKHIYDDQEDSSKK